MRLTASQIGWIVLAVGVIAAGYCAWLVGVAVLNEPHRQLREYLLKQIAAVKAGRDNTIMLCDDDGEMLVEFVKEKGELAGVKDIRLQIEYAQGTDRFLEEIRGMTGIAGMLLSKTNVSDVGLQHIATLPDLTSLGLHKVRLSDDGLRLLEVCPQLRILSITPRDVELVSIPRLVATARVEALSLHAPNDPDWIREGMAKITEAPFLRELLLYCSKITPVELRPLRERLPHCRVRAFDEFVLGGPLEIAPLPQEPDATGPAP